MPKSARASALSHKDLPSPHKEQLAITECMSEEQRPRWDFTHAQDDLNLRMLEGSFSFGAA